jgi:hypothetical protein
MICGRVLILVWTAVVSPFREAEVTGEAISSRGRRTDLCCSAAMVEGVRVIILSVRVTMLRVG